MSEQSDRILKRIGERPVAGQELLYEVRSFIARFCIFPSEQALDAVALWVAHAHMIEHFFTTPRLALLSPEPQSGKTRVLDILNLLVPDSMFVFNATPATIFRSLANRQITLLFDEVDTIWKGRGSDESKEELRALLNAGYRRGATVPRCVGSNFEVEHFQVYAAVALAGIGGLPDTVRSRSVIVPMRRRMRHEKVEAFNIRRHESEGHLLRERLANWAEQVGETTGEAFPSMPQGVEDRNEEVWSPLIAIADEAGHGWPELARKACTELIRASIDNTVSLGIRLLADIKFVFGDQERMSTATLLDLLTSEHSGLDDDAPWSELYGRPLNARKLAEILKPYGIKSTKVKVDGFSLRGYRIEDFWDAWQRWLPIPEQAEPAEPMELRTDDRIENSVLGHDSEVPADQKAPGPKNADTELNTAGNGIISTRGSGSSASSGLIGVTGHD